MKVLSLIGDFKGFFKWEIYGNFTDFLIFWEYTSSPSGCFYLSISWYESVQNSEMFQDCHFECSKIGMISDMSAPKLILFITLISQAKVEFFFNFNCPLALDIVSLTGEPKLSNEFFWNITFTFALSYFVEIDSFISSIFSTNFLHASWYCSFNFALSI